jgi:hypothetical protein
MVRYIADGEIIIQCATVACDTPRRVPHTVHTCADATHAARIPEPEPEPERTPSAFGRCRSSRYCK